MKTVQMMAVGFLLAIAPSFDSLSWGLDLGPEQSQVEKRYMVPDEVVAQSLEQPQDIVLLVRGNFNNGCYQPGEIEYHMDPDGKVFIRDMAFYYASGMCTMALKPYEKKIALGDLNRGHYQVYAQDSDLEMHFVSQFNVDGTQLK